MNKSADNSGETDKRKPPKIKFSRFWTWLPFLIFWVMIWQWVFVSASLKTIPYSSFKEDLLNHKIAEVSLGDDEITGRFLSDSSAPSTAPTKPKDKPWYAPLLPPYTQAPLEFGAPEAAEKGAEPADGFQYFRTVRVDDPGLVEQLMANGVRFTGTKPSLFTHLFWSWILPFALIFLIWNWIGRRFSNLGNTSPFGIGKSRAKLVSDSSTGVTFADVAGCDEAKQELEEVVDFLKRPDRYKALGATIPKGVLLVGPPGTGKTLLARAVAGEAKVMFFSISGSDFVEMFVGVGAARVRDMFAEAKKKSPCIMFIDEIDAVGRQRTTHVGIVNDEREQTLNQLLSEMDGFEPNTDVIILAATNRPEVLDPALLRPGRFDRQIVIDAPDKLGREAILKVHVRNKPLADDVDLKAIAQTTPGLSGADLANIVNEAAVLATRRGKQKIAQADFSDAVEKILAGPEQKSRRLGERERKRVAYHETGHALVASFCHDADPVRKISIVPRGKAALGYTLQVPENDRWIFTKGALLDRIRGLLGGRAAEDLVFNEFSTGAENDLEKATAIAQHMVCFYGMGKMSMTHYGEKRPLYIVQGQGETFTKNCSPETARQIDEEVSGILDQAYTDAKSILMNNRHELDTIALELLKRETIEEAEFKAFLGKLATEKKQHVMKKSYFSKSQESSTEL